MNNPKTISNAHGTYKTGSRVWIVDKFGTRAGTVSNVSQWLCRKGQSDEHYCPFLTVKYDEKFDPFNFAHANHWSVDLWRPEEIDTLRPQEFVSACCDAPILMHDKRGHGKCKKCKENTGPMEPEI